MANFLVGVVIGFVIASSGATFTSIGHYMDKAVAYVKN